MLERTLLLVESEAMAPESSLTHLHVVVGVASSEEDPRIFFDPAGGSPWIHIAGAPPIHQKAYAIDLTDFLEAHFPSSDVVIGVQGLSWPQDGEPQALVAGQVLRPAGLTGLLRITMSSEGLEKVPKASCVPTGPELCDDLDNDCDGETDENVMVEEVCDGLDNDCDGETDESGDSLCDDGIACTLDACAPAQTACDPDALGEDGRACCTNTAGEEEHAQCEASDSDPCTVDTCEPGFGCRSIIDTVLCPGCETSATCASDNPCTVVACQKCSPGDDCPPGFPGRCESVNLAAAPCDDGDPCSLGDVCSEGQCVSGSEKACDDLGECGVGSCDPETGSCVYAADPTKCDDGVACTEDLCDVASGQCSNPLEVCECKEDEQCPDDGNPCTTSTCTEDKVCVVQKKASGIDCEVDGQPCWSQAVCDGLGSCVAESFKAAGTPCDDGDSCTDGDFCSGQGACTGLPPEEICDGLDNDCDGLTDEGIETIGEPCDGADEDLCIGGVLGCTPDGLIVCQGDDQNSQYEALCDGKDEDCDGKIDETFKDQGLGQSCTSGSSEVGADCEILACDPEDPKKMICLPISELDAGSDAGSSASEQPEVCNGIDDNCNGEIDEPDLMVDPEIGVGCGTGACADGTMMCDASGTPVCDTAYLASTEVCNGIDDDCDGTTDEEGACGATLQCDVVESPPEPGAPKSDDGEPEELLLDMTTNGSGSVWTGVLLLPQGSVIEPQYELRRYTPGTVNTAPKNPTTIPVGFEPTKIKYDYSFASHVLVNYSEPDNAVWLYDTMMDAEIWMPFGPSLDVESSPVPIQYSPPNEDFLVVSNSGVDGASADLGQYTQPYWWELEDWTEWVLWKSGEVISAAWTGNRLLALAQGNLLSCLPSWHSEQLPSQPACPKYQLPKAGLNTIVMDPAQHGQLGQQLLVASLGTTPMNIFRFDLSPMNSDQTWLLLSPPQSEEVLISLDVYEGILWALMESGVVKVLKLNSGELIAEYALPLDSVPKKIVAGAEGAFVLRHPPNQLIYLNLVCQ